MDLPGATSAGEWRVLPTTPDDLIELGFGADLALLPRRSINFFQGSSSLYRDRNFKCYGAMLLHGVSRSAGVRISDASYWIKAGQTITPVDRIAS